MTFRATHRCRIRRSIAWGTAVRLLLLQYMDGGEHRQCLGHPESIPSGQKTKRKMTPRTPRIVIASSIRWSNSGTVSWIYCNSYNCGFWLASEPSMQCLRHLRQKRWLGLQRYGDCTDYGPKTAILSALLTPTCWHFSCYLMFYDKRTGDSCD